MKISFWTSFLQWTWRCFFLWTNAWKKIIKFTITNKRKTENVKGTKWKKRKKREDWIGSTNHGYNREINSGKICQYLVYTKKKSYSFEIHCIVRSIQNEIRSVLIIQEWTRAMFFLINNRWRFGTRTYSNLLEEQESNEFVRKILLPVVDSVFHRCLKAIDWSVFDFDVFLFHSKSKYENLRYSLFLEIDIQMKNPLKIFSYQFHLFHYRHLHFHLHRRSLRRRLLPLHLLLPPPLLWLDLVLV